MQTPSIEKIPRRRRGRSNTLKRGQTKEINIIETTYEKVLAIINNVKEFLRQNMKNSQKLVNDLKWVIKVISNKSLYKYDIKKSELSRQNSEFNKFINFVTKYNEEIIEMNKKHFLVSGLINLVKKQEMLNKPSLCLKKILPQELQNMDYKKEKEKKNRKKNLINILGNGILKLYYEHLEKKKKEGKGDDDEEEKVVKNKTSVQTIEAKDKKSVKNDKIKNDSKIFKFDEDIYDNNKSDLIKKFNTIENDFKNNSVKHEKLNSSYNTKNNKKKTNNEKNNRNIDSRYLLQNYNTNFNSSYSYGQRKNKNIIKIIKNSQPALNTIKNPMKNYYLKNTFIEHQGYNAVHNYNLNKNINKPNINGINHKINKSSYFDRGSFENKKKTESSPYKNKKNKDDDNKERTLYLKNLDNALIRKRLLKSCNDNTFFSTIESLNKSKNHLNKNTIKLIAKQMNTVDYKKSILYNINKSKNKKKMKNNIKQKILVKKNLESNNNNDNYKRINNYINTGDHIIPIREEKVSLKTLIDQHFNDMKMITDKDFDIFKFKSKVGYKNVLPLMCHCILNVLGLLNNRIIVLSKLESFLQSVNENYKESTLYHNSLHGADVTQTLCVFFINSNAEEICETSVLDLLGIIVSAMGHDLGHPGLTNNFHINAQTDLAMTYNDISCLENYHTSFLFKILKKDENNILERLSVENYKSIRKRMINQILATDMANHGEVLSLIKTKVKSFQYHEKEGEGEGEGEGEEEKDKEKDRFNLLSGNEKTKFDEQQILLNYLMHSADLGHNCKKYEISKKWIHLLCEEFWIQGDKEKSLGIPVSFLCDRDKIDVPASQVNFLRGFILSSFDCLVAIFPNLKYTMENAKNNIREWQSLLDEHRVTGWTPNNELNDENEI